MKKLKVIKFYDEKQKNTFFAKLYNMIISLVVNRIINLKNVK